MSRWTSRCFSATRIAAGVKSGESFGRLILLFVISLFLTLSIAAGNATADKLFQSPLSPAAVQPASPGEQPAQPAEAGEQPVLEAVPPDGAPTPHSRPEPLPATQSDQRSRDENTSDTEGQGPHNFILDRAELIDSVVVSGAYVWACCGISLLLLAPLFLLVLEIRGRSKMRKDEEL